MIFAIAMTGRITNLDDLVKERKNKGSAFIKMSGNQINQVELVAKIIAEKENIPSGIQDLVSNRRIRQFVNFN